VTLALSVLAAKAYAVLLGPSGVGLLALMQSVVNLGVMVATGGLVMSTISATASAAARGDRHNERAIARAALVIGLAAGAGGAVLLIVFRQFVADAVLGSGSRTSDVLILALALLLSVAASIQLALLMGLHRIRAVVAVNIGTSLTATGIGVAVVAAFGEAALAPAILVTAISQLGFSRIAIARARRTAREAPSSIAAAAGALLRVGLPVTASQLANNGAQLFVPVLVLAVLGTVEVGYYRAAAAVSISYLTFFLAMLAQDYFPRISGAVEPAAAAALIERRMRLVVGLGMPIIFALLAAGPLLIDLLYAREFAPAFGVLRWQLAGDLVRLPAWVLAFALLARGKSSVYFGAELISGLSLLAGTLLGLTLIGLVGSGVGYAVSQLIYYGVVWLLVRRLVATTPGRLQAVLLAATAITTLILMADLGGLERMIFALAAAAAAVVAWPRLYQLHRAGEL
jgi:PST family polysaccharide transporter